MNVICTQLAESALQIARRTGTGNAFCGVSQLFESIMNYELLRDGSESYDDVRGYIELHYQYRPDYWTKYGLREEDALYYARTVKEIFAKENVKVMFNLEHAHEKWYNLLLWIIVE